MKKALIFLFLSIFIAITACKKQTPRILVFSKTEGFRHSSIDEGQLALLKLGKENGILVDTTENSDYFKEETLKQYAAVVFLNTTGDVLDYPQQAHFERYIQAGGGYVGIHSATDTEYDWKWYNHLVGAYFKDHPKIQEATLNCENHDHPATDFLEDTWIRKDEWYNFKSLNEEVNLLLTIDESTYEGGTHGDKDHPMSWYHEYDGGRAFYTALGHTEESYEEPLFLKHLLGGIRYAISNGKLNYNLAHTIPVPEENRFVKEVLDFNLDEPMELDELPNRGMLFIERRGGIKLYDFELEATKNLAQLEVRYENEDGLLGLAVDPNYRENNWIYLCYSVVDESDKEMGKQRVSRFDLVEDSLLLASEKVLLEIPVIRKCCHSGGGLEFDKDGLLYIGLGDNTNPFESKGYAPIDEGPNRALWDAQKSAANTNDLRGKILRIRPEADGTYSIPKGNLFPEGTANTRPEIYVMGCRNPFRFSIDSQTDFVYWGDVGPDAGEPDSLRGPEGMGEFDQAREAGFFGWPYTRGNNQAYGNHDFQTQKTGAKFDPNTIINDSPNNTGLQQLPPIQESMIWYGYKTSPDFRWLGKGGVNPMGGTVYHASDYPNAEQTYPAYFENNLFVYEWMRDWMFVVTLDEDYNYEKAEAFMPNTEFSHPMDMLFGSDGNMYVLEYGQKWNVRNMDARLNQIRYVEGNRQPIAAISSDKVVGGVPLTVQFSAAESIDYDEDDLQYAWNFTGKESQSTEANPSFTFEEAGVYQVELTVTDPAGEVSTTQQKIVAGNDPPKLRVELAQQQSIFRKGETIDYQVVVEDTEDGTTANQSIAADKVKVSLSYIPEGADLILASLGHQQFIEPKGLQLINDSDCRSCHAIDKRVAGPSYQEIAERYTQSDKNLMVSRIIKGSQGVWGELLMSAHPQHSIEEVQNMVDYIMSLKSNKHKSEKSMPLSGTIAFDQHPADASTGQYVLMASYVDSGHPELNDAQLSAQEQVVFKPPFIEAESADERSEGTSVWDKDEAKLVGSILHNTYLRFNKLGLAGVKNIQLTADYNTDYHYGGKIEIRQASADGTLLGQLEVDHPANPQNIRTTHIISIQATSGLNDIYVVFKNPNNPEQYILNADRLVLGY